MPSPHDRACSALLAVLSPSHSDLTAAEVAAAVPRRWVRYGDLVLLPAACLTPGSLLATERHRSAVWTALATGLGAGRLAVREGGIESDDFRTPRVQMMVGESPWVEHRDNGIVYSWDVTRCMFSRGNLSEKMRVATWDCSGQVVVDLFAGIGYFSLPLAVKSNLRHLHACEWNPAAVEALRKNVRLNRIPDGKVTIHEGDNRSCCPHGVAQRVLLGLLPTARLSWRTACQALDPHTGGWLHVHENVDSVNSEKAETEDGMTCNTQPLSAWRRFADELKSELSTILGEQGKWEISVRHMEFVKSYAPHVDHLVFDVFCAPVTNAEMVDETTTS